MDKKNYDTPSTEKKQEDQAAFCMICGQRVPNRELNWNDNDELVCPLCLAEYDNCGCGDEEN